MKSRLLVMAAIFCGVALAQQTGGTTPATAINANAPVFAPAQTLGQQVNMMAAQPSEGLTAPEVQRELELRLRYDASLAGTSVGVRTDDQSVVLTGNVKTESQHDEALGIAKTYSGNRAIVDQIAIQ